MTGCPSSAGVVEGRVSGSGCDVAGPGLEQDITGTSSIIIKIIGDIVLIKVFLTPDIFPFLLVVTPISQYFAVSFS
jgi:hypothetical protein